VSTSDSREEAVLPKRAGSLTAVIASFHSSSSPLFTSPLCSPSVPVRRARTCLRGSSCFSCNFPLCPARPTWWCHSSHSSFLYLHSRPFPHQALRLAFGGFFFACLSLDVNWGPSFLPLSRAVLLFCSPISSTSFTILVYTAYRYIYIYIYIYILIYHIYSLYMYDNTHFQLLHALVHCKLHLCTLYTSPTCTDSPSNMSVSFIT